LGSRPLQTAALAVFKDLKIPIPSPANLPAPKGEWALVLGGASSVGKMAIQVGRALGSDSLCQRAADSESVRV
jgi:NADPH:quinone reductase-like Zn-dependent oxidoreductase